MLVLILLQLFIFSGIFLQMLNKFYAGQLSEPEENLGFLDITTCKELHVMKYMELSQTDVWRPLGPPVGPSGLLEF